ncbi:hypothetical protein P7C73_g879, partial [Tremellales sp. Uapishka_1]
MTESPNGSNSKPEKKRSSDGYRALLSSLQSTLQEPQSKVRSREWGSSVMQGDIDRPSEPPCTRCKRESRECLFAPSRRGGNNAKKRQRNDEEDSPELEKYEGGGTSADGLPYAEYGFPSPQQRTATSHSVSLPLPIQPIPPPRHASYGSTSLQALLQPSPTTKAYPLEQSPGQLHNPGSTSTATHYSPDTGTDQSPAHHASSQQPPRRRRSGSSSPNQKRRKLHMNPPMRAADPSSIVVADMQNESDALHILALASERDEDASGGTRGQGEEGRKSSTKVGATARKTSADLKDFPLVKLGIVNADQPMVPASIIPRTPDQIAAFARDERYLLAAMVIIASRHNTSPGMRDVHDRSWATMRGWLSDITCLGAPPTIGLVEALLLIAENLPRDPARSTTGNDHGLHAIGFGEEVHGAENRQAWMLIGMAIRCGYGLGIDKLALKLFPDAERTFELERGRLVWTYCYLFDRHVSLRLGKAFWSRGPVAVCFQGFSSSAQTGPAAAAGNFPFLREKAMGDGDDQHAQEDLASLVQAYVELTQLMSNAHDVLYPNAARTRAIVIYGEYFKYLDEFARSLDGFKVLWRQKQWAVFPLTDAVWAMFYYVQLYICAFSFQAHVERASMKAEEEYLLLEQQHRADGFTGDIPRPPLSLFPRGAAASPDARTLKLIDRLCSCFEQSSSDEDHPAARYGRQLQGLRKKLAGLSVTTGNNSPGAEPTIPIPPIRMTGPSSVPPPHQDGMTNTSYPWVTQPTPAPPPDLSFMQDTSAWAFPITTSQSHSQPISFFYPSAIPNPIVPATGSVAPPHQQLLTDVTQEIVNTNLGFATLDDWFNPQMSQTTQNNGQGNGGNNANSFDTLDLADFWMKVGPGEAQGGFPFR